MNLNFLNTNRGNRPWMWAFFVALLLCTFVYLGVGIASYLELYLGQWHLFFPPSLSFKGDAEWVWQVNAYFCRGYNTVDVLAGNYTVLPEIGKVPQMLSFGTPWTFVLANLFLPGFLPFSAAIWVGIFWAIFLWTWVFVWMSKILNKTYKDSLFTAIVLLSCLCYSAVAAQIGFMNPALWISPLLLLSVMASSEKKYEYLSGILLGLAMLKPQTAALFFIPFLWRKQYKIIFVGAAVIMLPWLWECITLKVGPISLFFSYFGKAVTELSPQGTTAQSPDIMGLFGPLFTNGNPFLSTVFHLVFFVLLSGWLCYKYRKAPFFVLFSIPVVFSMFWLYCQPTGRAVSLLSMAILISLYTQKHKAISTWIALLCLAMYFSPIYSSYLLVHFNAMWMVMVTNGFYILGLIWVLYSWGKVGFGGRATV